MVKADNICDAKGVTKLKIKLSHGLAYVEKAPGIGWYLVSIVVDENFREKGVGTKLMNSVLKKCGRPIYLLATDELGGDPFRLKKFYKRFRFVPYRQRRCDGLPYNANMILYN